MALVFTACASEADDASNLGRSDSPSSTQAGGGPSGESASGDVSGELGRYTDHNGFERVYVEVDSGITDDDLIGLATRLHEGHPDVAKFYFMDDDSQIDQVLAALPETEQGVTDNWPLDWVTEHTTAVLELTIFPDEPQQRWILYRGLTADSENPLLELV